MYESLEYKHLFDANLILKSTLNSISIIIFLLNFKQVVETVVNKCSFTF